MKTLISLFPVLAALISSAPSSSSKGKGTFELATSDGLSALSAVSELNKIGVYQGLEYQSIDTLAYEFLNICKDVTPVSSQTVAVSAPANLLLQGNPAAIIPTGSFALKYFSFGCVIGTLETVASLPETCTVAFTAYKERSSTPFDTVNQVFDPTNPVLSGMTKATFLSS